MALATRCPSCSTVFRISTAQAAAKGGMVRCGLCAGVFDALDALVRVEDLDVIDEVDVSEVRPIGDADIAPVGGTEQVGGAAAGPDVAAVDAPSPVDATAAATTVVDGRIDPDPIDGANDVAANGAADVATRGAADSAPVAAADRAWWLPADASGDAAAADGPVVTWVNASPPDEAAGAPSTGRRTDAAPVSLEGTHPTFMRPDPATTHEGRAARWTYGLLSLVAAVGLLLQCAYLWRDELAARVPPARPLLTALCAPLRCVVDDPAHPDAISIESASVQASGPNLDVYVLTALLRNREPIDVRYPHLELVLTDLQDRPILRRALRPEDYVPAPASGAGRVPAGFPAGSELPIRVVFELNGLRFVGYRLDRFYP